MSQPIGGYFDLELSRTQCDLFRDPVQSASAAFTLLLRAVRPAAVWMSLFIYDAILSPPLQVYVRRLLSRDTASPLSTLQKSFWARPNG